MEMKQRLWKKTAALLLSGMLVVLAGGCGNAGSTEQALGSNAEDTLSQDNHSEQAGENAMGRYVESIRKITDREAMFQNIVEMEDGSLAVLDAMGGKYESKDNGETWENVSIPGLTGLRQSSYIGSAILSCQGAIAVQYEVFTEEEQAGNKDSSNVKNELPSMNWEYMLIKPDGTELKFGEEFNDISHFVFSSQGELYISAEKNKVYRLNTETGEAEMVLELEDEKCYLNVNNNILVAASFSGIGVYDLDKKQRIEDKVLTEFFVEKVGNFDYYAGNYASAIIGQREDNSIYIACRDGLYRHVIGGSTVEQVMDGSLNSFSSPSVSFLDMVWLRDDFLMVLFSEGAVASYQYDPDMPTIPDIQISAYSLKKNELLQQAITIFQQEHPEIYVKYEIGVNDGTSITREDALKNLNTRILSGKGPDLILLDELPVRNYIEKGLLVDLTPVLQEMKQEVDFLPAAENTYKDGDKIYAIPAKFKVPTIIGEKKYLETSGSLKDLADTLESIRAEQPKGQILGLYTEEQVMVTLGIACSGTWEKEDGSIDSAALTEFLTQAKRIYETEIAGITQQDIDWYLETQESHSFNRDILVNKDDIYTNLGGSVFNLATGDSMMSVGYVDQYFALATVFSAMKATKNPDLGIALFSLDGKKYFYPNAISGILSSSKNQEMAGELLKVILGQGTQDILMGGYPVNRKSYENCFVNPAGEEKTIGAMAADGRSGKTAMLDITWPEDNYLNQYKEILEGADTADITDSVLKDTVMELGVSALNGKKTVEETVDEIISRLAIYLAE